MRSRELLIQITGFITALAAIITVTVGFRDFADVLRNRPAFLVALATLAAMAASAYTLLAYRFLTRNPIPLSISLLGFPGTGKSVYLTTLFDELQRYRGDAIRFAPYGRETIEAVTANLNALTSGNWLARTVPGAVFPYRATASLRGGLLPRKFKIEIADYAGEHISELNPSEAAWLHKTDYFKYVVQSDAVILTLDSAALLDADGATRETIQNAYIAAFQVLAEEKGATAARRLRSPVALLFLKMDLVPRKMSPEQMSDYVSKLVDVCTLRCQHFKVFYASSVGRVNEDGTPPKDIHPQGVIDPLIWILRRAVPITPSA